MTQPVPTTPEHSDAVVIERTFDAPIELVWRLWTDPEEFRTWYGPTGAEITVAELDVSVGGQRLVCMEMATPNGPMRMWFGGVHSAVEPPTLLRYTERVTDEHGVAIEDGPPTEVTVELSEVAGRTRMVMTHAGVPADSPGATGWQMAFEKMAVRLRDD